MRLVILALTLLLAAPATATAQMMTQVTQFVGSEINRA
jgi:hypothetical protein